MSKTFKTAGWLAVAGLLGAALIAPTAAFAASVDPILHDGNVKNSDCPAGTTGITLDDQNTSGSADGVTVEIDYDSDTKSLDFTATGGVVLEAFVKGGDAYNEYDYRPDGVTSDTDLVAPNNPSGGPAGLSHVVFCVAQNEESSSTTSSETSSTTTSSTTTSSTTTSSTTSSETSSTTSSSTSSTTSREAPSGSVEAATGTPKHTPPPTDTVAPTSGPTNGMWQMLLLGAAALLASILLLTPATAPRRSRR